MKLPAEIEVAGAVRAITRDADPPSQGVAFRADGWPVVDETHVWTEIAGRMVAMTTRLSVTIELPASPK